MHTKQKTVGEQLFEEYLAALSLSWQYEKSIGNRNPDYLVATTRGDILVEIEDLQGSDKDNEFLEAMLNGGPRASSWDPVSYINNAIRRAAKQLRPGKGQYPCLAVLHNESSWPYEEEMLVMQAMFGRLQLTLTVSADGPVEDDAQTEFSKKNRYLTRDSNTTISAVAILEKFRPNAGLLDKALDQNSDMRTDWETITKTHAQLESVHGEGFLDREEIRLRIFHNPWANVPLPTAAFGGASDEHMTYDTATSLFIKS